MLALFLVFASGFMKEEIKMDDLPAGREARALVKEPLPFRYRPARLPAPPRARRMNGLRCVDCLILGLVFRWSLSGLLGRIKKLRYREAEAELAEATQGVQAAAEEAAKPLSEDAEEGERQSRERIDLLMQSAAAWGFFLGQNTTLEEPPEARIIWHGRRPELTIDGVIGQPLWSAILRAREKDLPPDSKRWLY
jgi:hypothetical protein